MCIYLSPCTAADTSPPWDREKCRDTRPGSSWRWRAGQISCCDYLDIYTPSVCLHLCKCRYIYCVIQTDSLTHTDVLQALWWWYWFCFCCIKYFYNLRNHDGEDSHYVHASTISYDASLSTLPHETIDNRYRMLHVTCSVFCCVHFNVGVNFLHIKIKDIH